MPPDGTVGPADTTSVTVIVSGELTAPVELIVTVALSVPAVCPCGLAAIVIVPGVVPDDGVTVSQGPLPCVTTALQEMLPPGPALVMFNVTGVNAGAPAVPWKDNCAWDSVSCPLGFTCSATLIFCGVLPVLGVAMVTVPV